MFLKLNERGRNIKAVLFVLSMMLVTNYIFIVSAELREDSSGESVNVLPVPVCPGYPVLDC